MLIAAPEPGTHACLLAVATKESGAWLSALPMSSVGLLMEDDVIQVVVGLRLRAALCTSYQCHNRRVMVDHRSTHGLHCTLSKDRHPQHAALNDIFKRALDAAKIPSHLEPTGLYRLNGKRPDGASIVP